MTIKHVLGTRNLRNGTTNCFLPFSVNEISPSCVPMDSTGPFHAGLVWSLQKRWMTKSKRVQDRSSKKRVHDLEIVTERWKVVSKVLVVMEVLRKEPEQIIPLRRDKKGVIWCGLTEKAEELVQEENRLLEEHTEKAVEHVTRLLMMSVDKRLPLDKIAHFRRDMGLPFDFRIRWVHMFPEQFRVVKRDDVEYLELTSWNPSWAITELEKRAMAGSNCEPEPHSPGLLSLPFPMKFPPNFKKLFRIGGKIEHFQKRSYLSPYTDARELTPGSQEFDKRAVAIMHEILSFTIERRLVTDHLTHFRQEFVMPQKLMRLLLKHYGIFYVSERGKRFSVFLTEAYEGSGLIDRCPLYVWKEKILGLTGYRGRRKRIESFNDSSDALEDSLFGNDCDAKASFLQIKDEEDVDTLEHASLAEDSEMDIGDMFDYKGT